MDNLTHSLIGVFLSRAGLNRLTPDAGWTLLLAANAPDIDVVAMAGGPAAALHWHRNFTHGLPCSLILAGLSVLIVRLITRRTERWLNAILIAWIGVLSHLLLDMTNNYGIRLLAPFSGRWFEWDTTAIIDPWIWTALLIAIGAPLLSKIVSSEIGERRRKRPPRGWAIAALSFVLLFDSARAVLHRRALQTLEARYYAGETARRVAAFPTAFNPFRWRALAETNDRYYLYELDLNDDFNPDSGRALYKNSPGEALNALRMLPQFAALLEFAQYPLWRVVDDENNSRYNLTDLRFGDPAAGTFTCSARLTSRRTAADERCDFTFAPHFEPQ